ncbi:MAG: ABC transporter permease [Gemmataceae bacterium]|nr:ABC transporter permease [Gemmataceae bacterium]MDW8264515.1 ABC transporter permease subunit [Gemmataceae bacterium]
MNLPAAFFALRWLWRETFRQAQASGLLAVMLVVSGICIVFCLSVHISGPDRLLYRDGRGDFLPAPEAAKYKPELVEREGIDVAEGEVSLAFGAIRVPLRRDALDVVRYIEMLLAVWVADAGGVLLALVWTAGFLPAFLDPGSALVLLAKPVPRWLLLGGKFLGVVTFVACQALIFVGGTWLALGVRTGVWDLAYWLCVPLLLVHFVIFFSCSTLLAVLTRSPIACILGSILFWLACWGANFAYASFRIGPEAWTGLGAGLLDGIYWVLPKPADLGILLFDALRGEAFFARSALAEAVQQSGLWLPSASVATSLGFTVALLVVAAYRFARLDY